MQKYKKKKKEICSGTQLASNENRMLYMEETGRTVKNKIREHGGVQKTKRKRSSLLGE